jgi:predicted nucleic acid-binding OB-fold protein
MGAKSTKHRQKAVCSEVSKRDFLLVDVTCQSDMNLQIGEAKHGCSGKYHAFAIL